MVSSDYVIPLAIGLSCSTIILVLLVLITIVVCLICRVPSNSNVAPSTSARHHGSRLNSARSQGRKEPKAPPPEGLTKKRKGSQTSQSLYEDSHYKDGRGLKLQGSGMGAINPIMVEDDEGSHAGMKNPWGGVPHSDEDQDSDNPYD